MPGVFLDVHHISCKELVLANRASKLHLALGAVWAVLELEVSCGILEGSSQQACAVQQGIGGNVGGGQAGYSEELVQRVSVWKRSWIKVGSRRWWMGKCREEKRNLPRLRFLPGWRSKSQGAEGVAELLRKWDEECGMGVENLSTGNCIVEKTRSGSGQGFPPVGQKYSLPILP